MPILIPLTKISFEKTAESLFTLPSNAVCIALLIGLSKSAVLSTFGSPTIDLVIPATVPVKVGEARGAFKTKSDVSAFLSKAICVALLIGFAESAVLFTLFKPTAFLSKDKADFNEAMLVVPVPPFSIGMIPFIFSASTLFAN